jgi:hypothetical protein
MGIDEWITTRAPGALIVFCPSCPEPGFNMEDNWESTPSCLRYALLQHIIIYVLHLMMVQIKQASAPTSYY